MDLKKADKHFAKLTKFYESIRADGEVNKIEADLLKSYISKFYESLMDLDTETIKPKSNGISTKKGKEIKKPSNGGVSKKIEFPSEPVREIPQIVEETVAVSTAQVVQKAVIKSDPLFDFEMGSELSDKLSNTKIADISTSMSINERVSTIVELFAGNKEAFENTMDHLNGLSSFQEAKTYLSSNVVEKYNWNDGERPSKVKSLMKLVYRRYV